jgi:signal transduction histidine kinase
VLTSLFQSVRELLFNVVKHAGVDEATVSLSQVPRPRPSVMVEVTDRGRGFEPAKRRLVPTEEGGFGLFSIRERIDLIGGRVEVASSPGKGTRVTLSVPLKKPGGGPRKEVAPQEQAQPVRLAPTSKTRPAGDVRRVAAVKRARRPRQ